MRVLILGSGAREHALAAALARSPLLERLFVAPGNPGTATLATNVPVGATDVAALVAFAREHRIDLVVPGPEAPLVAGVADALAEAGIACCGPTLAAARLEGSKRSPRSSPTPPASPPRAGSASTDADAARDFVRRRGAPIVVKADGLAAGKGVVVAASVAEAEAAIPPCCRTAPSARPARRVVIEECLAGEEVSLFALCDGTDRPSARRRPGPQARRRRRHRPQHRRHGRRLPAPPASARTQQEAAMDAIIRPALAAMAPRGTPFRGVLFAGLMLTASGPALIEFNVRLGDPECQALLPRLRSDLLAALRAATDGTLADGRPGARPGQPPPPWSWPPAATPATPARGGTHRGPGRAAALPGRARPPRRHRRPATATSSPPAAACSPWSPPARTSAPPATPPTPGSRPSSWADGFCRGDIGLRALRSVRTR